MAWQNTKSSLRAGSAHQISLTVVEFAYCVSPSLHPLPLLLLCFISIHNVLDTARHVEVVLADMIVLAIKNLLEATDGILQRHVSAFAPGKCLRYYEWL